MSDSGDPPGALSKTPIARKRRRPALSCEQCRRRKIKCDRNYPCGHCVQSKIASCSYSASSPAVSSHVSKSAPPIHDTSITFPSRPKVDSSAASSNHISDASPRASHSDASHSTWPSPSAEEQLGPGPSNKDLLNRVLSLERQLSEATGSGSTKITSGLMERTTEFGLELADKDSSDKDKVRGTVSKTRFFGQSHWMYSFGTFDHIACMTIDRKHNTPEFGEDLKNSDVFQILEECKSLARAAKATPHNKYLLNPNFRDSVPPKQVCDQLVASYLRTSETVYRILHIPSFQREYNQYWTNPAAASSPFILKLLLVMAIGATFYQEPDSAQWRAQALHWVYAAQAWLSSPFEKKRLHISGLQIHCLLLIARIDVSVAGDLVWASAGTLVRTAFQMGYHRDPKYLPRMSPLHAELRRRLWATVMELNIQLALDSGMPALIRLDDFDTELPVNVDDIDIDDDVTVMPESKPREVYTQTSLQIRLLESLSLRLEVVAHSNNIRLEPTYDEVLRLGSQLAKCLRENKVFVAKTNHAAGYPVVSQFHQNIFDVCVRRFLLTLHRPFSAKAMKDPRYYFSRKMCLDISEMVMTYPSTDSSDPPMPEGVQDDYTRMTIVRGGFSKGLLVMCSMVLFAEIIMQMEEECNFTKEKSQADRGPLKALLKYAADLLAKRIEISENNVKGHLFMSVVLAQIEAYETGQNPEQMVMATGRKSANYCLELLKKRIPNRVSQGDYENHVDNGTSPDGIGLVPVMEQVHPNMDFTMDDWNMDFNLPESWLISGWENNQPWGLQI